jgi:hypothetical protein
LIRNDNEMTPNDVAMDLVIASARFVLSCDQEDCDERGGGGGNNGDVGIRASSSSSSSFFW